MYLEFVFKNPNISERNLACTNLTHVFPCKPCYSHYRFDPFTPVIHIQPLLFLLPPVHP